MPDEFAGKKSGAMGAGGIPQAARQFLKTRLVPEEYAQLVKLLQREANSRPLGASSMPAMDKRHARPGDAYYYSTMSGHYVGPNGIARQRPRPLDLSRAERELADIIAGRR